MTTDWSQTAAKLIYESYPGSDLLPIEPPSPDQDIDDYEWVAEGAADTLFLFICREASDDGLTAEQFLKRMDTAIHDIEAVYVAVQEHIDRGYKT